MKNYLVEIKKDLFNIAYDLRKIDRDYKVFFNKKLLRYEVYQKDVFSFVVGKTLDRRAVVKAHKTNIRNFKTIFREMEMTNKKLEIREKENLKNSNMNNLNDMLNFADKSNRDYDFSLANTTRWI